MGGEEGGWLGTALWGVAALLAFWIIGAYNRLVGLRHAVAQAWPQVDAALRPRRDALPLLQLALREPLADARDVLDAVGAASSQCQAAADALRARPLRADAAAAWRMAEQAMDAALDRLLARLASDDVLRRRADVAAALQQLHDASLRLALARQGYDDTVSAYNAAVRQQPTRLLAPLFGFRPAGTLG